MGLHTGGRVVHAALLGLAVGWSCSGCSRSAQQPAVTVPVDCQKFLDKYFEAIRAKDLAKIQDFSSYVHPSDRQSLPAASVPQLLATKRQIAVQVFDRMSSELGDFKSYAVVRANETTITAADLAARRMQGATGLVGHHAEILCNAEFSKKPATIHFNLIKDTPEAEYSVEAWGFETSPF